MAIPSPGIPAVTGLARRDWVPAISEDRVAAIASRTRALRADAVAAEIEARIAENRRIHEDLCINLNPATL